MRNMKTLKEKQRLKQRFRNQPSKHVVQFNKAVSTRSGDWVVKGFIDIAKNIYTLSVDTKVISKIFVKNKTFIPIFPL